jgi:hypothetical protein
MRALVVYESIFGNTQAVAKAVTEGMSQHMETALVECSLAPTTLPSDIDLLVVGGPTHAFSLSRPSTRESAKEQATGDVVSRGTGIREWLETLAVPGDHTTCVATFDTRVRHPHLPGSAASAALKRLRRLGLRPAAPAKSFWVDGTPGPLAPGQEDDARAWGTELARGLVQTTPQDPSGERLGGRT